MSCRPATGSPAKQLHPATQCRPICCVQPTPAMSAFTGGPAMRCLRDAPYLSQETLDFVLDLVGATLDLVEVGVQLHHCFTQQLDAEYHLR